MKAKMAKKAVARKAVVKKVVSKAKSMMKAPGKVVIMVKAKRK